MTGLTSVVVPVALGGALLAGLSQGRTSWTRPHRSATRRGARWARRRDLRPLLVAADVVPRGRLLLGVLPGVARHSGLAAETAQSLVVVGPTQSGKTTSLAVPAILGWRGPVLAASVKSDLLRHTLGTRARQGQVWCIDPTGCTGARASTWSPLTMCGRWRDACRAAAEICARRPRARARRRTVSSGTPPPPSSSPLSSSPRLSTGAPWPTSCAGSTLRRSGRSRPSSSAPHHPRCCMPPRRPGAVTTGRGAPSTRRPRRCSPPSPIR